MVVIRERESAAWRQREGGFETRKGRISENIFTAALTAAGMMTSSSGTVRYGTVRYRDERPRPPPLSYVETPPGSQTIGAGWMKEQATQPEKKDLPSRVGE